MHKLLRLTFAISLSLAAGQLQAGAQPAALAQPSASPSTGPITPASVPPSPSPSPAQTKIVQPIKIYPLPGGLDARPMLNSNSPELVNDAGILISTLPNQGKTDSPFLDYAFEGDFGAFCHHIFKDANPGERLLYLGLVASNLSAKPVRLTLTQGASYLSQPDALFKPLADILPNPAGEIYAGPGDRVATELLAGTLPLKDIVIEIPPGASRVVSSQPINTDVAILPPINGRSTLMHFHSDGPVYLSELAWLAQHNGEQFVPPTLEDYHSLLDAGKFAGVHEKTSLYTDTTPPTGPFFYGRVAGVSQGLSWQGKLWEGSRATERPAPGQKIGYPIATTYIKRFGTGQNQSGKMPRRYPDTPPENHGNYAVDYELEIPLHNDTKEFQSYSLALSQPLNPNLPADKPAEMVYMFPPNAAVMFRGSVRLRWVDEYKQLQDRLSHLVLRNGQEGSAFELITVPPRTHYDLKLSLVYPPDSTPPHLLTIERLDEQEQLGLGPGKPGCLGKDKANLC
ncbi:MAG: DUF3370 domain-containing protein [Candidatus Sericytochromatia bacterium]